jgi:WD40 repeat protein
MGTSRWRAVLLAAGVIIACAVDSLILRIAYGLDPSPPQVPSISGTSKLPVPSNRDQFRATQTIRGLFHTEYADHASAAKASLAAKLLSQGLATDGDLVLRFVSFTEARDLSASAGNLAIALSAIDSLDREFLVDAQAMRVAAFLQTVPVTSPEGCPGAIELGFPILDRSLGSEDFAGANRLLAALETLGNTSKQLPLVARVRARRLEMSDLQRDATSYRQAKEILRKTPADEAANSIVGRHLALVKGNFDEALPYLAKGSDPSLKALAVREAAKPAAPLELTGIADAWWDLGSRLSGLAEDSAHKHAVLFYTRARPALVGADLARVDSRIQGAPVLAAGTPVPAAPVPGTTPPRVVTPGAGNATSTHTFDLQDGPPGFVQFTADSKYVLCSGKPGTFVWEVETGKLVHSWKGSFGQALPDSRRAVVNPQDKWSVVDLQTGKEEAHLVDGSRHAIICRGGTSLLLEHDDKDITIEIYDLHEAGMPTKFDHYFPQSDRLGLSPDGKLFVTAPVWTDFVIHAYDSATGRETWRGDAKGGSEKLFFSRDGKFLVRRPHGPEIFVHDAQTGHILVECACSKWTHDAAIASNGRFIVAGFAEPSEGIRLFDLSAADKGKLKSVIWPADTFGFGVNVVVLSPDDHRVLVGCKDNQLRLFDVASGRLLAHFQHDGEVTAAAFSPDGLSAVSGDEKAVHIWHLPDPGAKK